MKINSQLSALNSQLRKGFTLIELLVVITIIATLAVTVFVALNPGQRLKDAKDARRTSDVDTILTAIHASIVDTKGTSPAGLSTLEQQLGTGATGCGITNTTSGCAVTAVSCLNLSSPLAKYLKSMPIDPSGAATYTDAKTGYSAIQDSNGLVTVRACGSEGTVGILSSR